LKILHLVGTLNPGGIERLVTELALNQKNNGLAPSVCCLLRKQGQFLATLEEAGVPVYEARYDRMPWLLVDRLAHVLRSSQPDVIHSHVNFSLLWQVQALRRTKLTPFVITQHTLLSSSPGIKLRSRWIYRGIKPYISRHVAVSAYAARYAGELYGVTPESLKIIYNGVDRSAFQYNHEARQKLREEWRIPRKVILWGSVGRLDPVKGYDFLLRTFSEVRKQFPTIILAIAGEGQQIEDLISIADRLECKKAIRWLGARCDIPAVLSAFDYYIQPSRKEAFPRSVLEALSSGLDVIASQVGGLVEIATLSEHVHLFPPEETDALADIMLQITKKGLSHNLRFSKCPGEFTFESMSKAYQILYDQVLST